MVALLDVNVLLALFDPDNLRHLTARTWFEKNAASGWATCPLTENGFVRVISQPAYTNPFDIDSAASALRASTTSPFHVFWPCDISLLDADLVSPSTILGPAHITDAYLLALAIAHGGAFVTFDHRINPASVAGFRPDRLIVL
ncbi:MAG: PIN domain-containing protein [Micrococcales bacterium]|nr:PIN domain-containing protein [Micrococcales bacterium]